RQTGFEFGARKQSRESFGSLSGYPVTTVVIHRASSTALSLEALEVLLPGRRGRALLGWAGEGARRYAFRERYKRQKNVVQFVSVTDVWPRLFAYLRNGGRIQLAHFLQH